MDLHKKMISQSESFVCVCVCVCVFYLRLCVDVGAVSDELLHHVCLAGEGSYVEGCVSFLLFKKKKKKTFYTLKWR